ncbi:AfsR/SARP family transcriptional regulator [Actinophytocola sp.]|uniref:AfsR/SARP family transcriptional regulator n=1 Tax=Actinophytocola sp. TaxID=1872138 RepID=UPI00389A74F2
MNESSRGVRIQLLGPVEVLAAGRRVELGPPRERCVLAALAVDAGHVVSLETLIDRVWGQEPPLRSRNALYVYVARLRQRLAGLLDVPRRSRGYVLDVEPDRVDVHHLRGLVAQAGGRCPPGRRVELLRAVVRGWGGEPVSDLTGDWVAGLRAAWEQERLDALVAWAWAELEVGNASATVAPLVESVGRYPLAESLVAALMRALHVSGRSADALDWYGRTRERLVAELGIDPGQQLREAYQAVLRGEQPAEPVEDAEDAAVHTDRSRSGDVTLAQLPLDIVGFAGRAAELARLDELLALVDREPTAAVVAVLWGTAGVGKTALAVRWAHQVRDAFPDGALHVNLRGFDPSGKAASPADAVRDLLDALGVPPQRVPAGVEAQVGLYRSLLHDRRVLVLLDNARDAEQVRPLLPGVAGCLAIITSRNQLLSLVVTQGAIGIPVDLLTVAEARELLVHRLGSGRVAAEPAVVDTVIGSCARLPLALAVVAAHAAARPDQSLAVLATQLAGGTALRTLTAGDARTDLTTVFSWSYRALTPPAARLFRLLGLHVGPDLAAAAAASLAGVPVTDVLDSLAELTTMHMAVEHLPGRWTLHDLLRAYAGDLAEELDPERDRGAALRRELDHYLHMADTAATLLNPQRAPIFPVPAADGVVLDPPRDAGEARRWFAVEHPVLRDMVPAAARAGFDAHAWQLARSMTTYLNQQGLWSEMAETQTVGLAAARRTGDRDGQVHTLRDLALAETRRGRYEEARAHYTAAADLCAETGDSKKWANVHRDLAELMTQQGRLEEAIHHLEQADTVREDDVGRANNAGSFGWCYALLGDHDQALRHSERALELAQAAGVEWTEASVWDTLGYIHHQLRHDHPRARACYQQALRIIHDVGDLYREAETLDHIADVCTAAGDTEAALTARHQARRIRREFDQTDAASQT